MLVYILNKGGDLILSNSITKELLKDVIVNIFGITIMNMLKYLYEVLIDFTTFFWTKKITITIPITISGEVIVIFVFIVLFILCKIALKKIIPTINYYQ